MRTSAAPAADETHQRGRRAKPVRRHGLRPWRSAASASLLLLLGCERRLPPPPPTSSFDGLPVTGSLADAHRAGFTRCIENRGAMRCRRDDVALLGHGPYSAAVDLAGGDGRGGFRALTLWHDRDQHAVQAVGETLRRRGWSVCFTGVGARGDQAIYARAGVPVRVSIDLSYYMKRRLRILPAPSGDRPPCPPGPRPPR